VRQKVTLKDKTLGTQISGKFNDVSRVVMKINNKISL
jgi:hypothetical protein